VLSRDDPVSFARSWLQAVPFEALYQRILIVLQLMNPRLFKYHGCAPPLRHPVHSACHHVVRPKRQGRERRQLIACMGSGEIRSYLALDRIPPRSHTCSICPP
jgi:hypothetical protein